MNTVPQELKKIGKEKFRITWKDGHVSEYTFRFLRQNCPCAGCRNEWTGEKILNPETVPVELKGLNVNVVGNYALQFVFSDQHQTGLYSFKHLRAICSCSQCAGLPETSSILESAP